MMRRRVSILDADLPVSVAFARSLGRAGVPTTAYSHRPRAAARYSRYVSDFRSCPDGRDTDTLVEWLVSAMTTGEIDLVAPTSDTVAFAVAEAHDQLGLALPGHPTPAAVRDCLFKDWFAERMAVAGFPAAPSATPDTVERAVKEAETLGYPVILKPRSHVAVGPRRGDVAGTPEKLAELFAPFAVAGCHSTALRHNADLPLPLLQRYFGRDEVDVISVCGCLGADGEVLSVGHARKLREWGRGRGVGTRFEALPEQSFTERAIEAVRQVLGAGLFEFEVLVHHPTGDLWSIDLNPRGYGQITLEVARGNDLPMRWYEAVTGLRLDGTRPHRRPPRYWQAGVPYYAGLAVTIARGPRRATGARDLLQTFTEPRVGAVLDRRDPGPAVAAAAASLRHPGGLIRPYLRRATDEQVAQATQSAAPT